MKKKDISLQYGGYHTADPNSVLTGDHFMQGDVACAEGAVAAGCNFFSGYPITPATEIMERLSLRLPELGGTFIQVEDELASLASVIGASYTGAKSMTATSGPGLSLMNENIGLAIMTETPCVIVDIMRLGPSTGQPTRGSQADVMQARWGSHGDYEIVVITPNSVQEMFDLTVKAFNISEEFRIPTLVVTDETIGHLRERIQIPPPEQINIFDRIKPKQNDTEFKPFKPDKKTLVPPMATFGDGFSIHVTGLTHDEDGNPDSREITQLSLVNRLCNKIKKNSDKIIQVEKIMTDDADVLVFAYGSVSRGALAAIKTARKNGIKAGLFRPITLWPFPEKELKETIENGVKGIVVAEMNNGMLVREVERIVKDQPINLLARPTGEPYLPTEIYNRIRKVNNK
ncbi:MAG: 2-oxoacid:acceptor oxidoreductase subunit alpha [Candidatus Ranarchaeia archaeon]